jgi:hypothetical protein
MSQHPRAETCFKNLSATGMFPVIPPTPFFQPSNCEVLIGIIEPLCASWIIREKEE